jgi:hypothetical protein
MFNTETVRSVKKVTTKRLVKRCSLRKRLVLPVNEDRDVALFFVFYLAIRRKLIRRSNQQFLKVVASNLPSVLDVIERLFVADPVSHAIGADIWSNVTRSFASGAA